MTLPKDDVAFLKSLGVTWRVEPDGTQAGFLIIENFDVSGGGFTPAHTTLMIRIPALYNMTKLDMWYCDPPIHINGLEPQATQVREAYIGRVWQRFSRHLNPGDWVAGQDGLRSFFTLIRRELQGKK